MKANVAKAFFVKLYEAGTEDEVDEVLRCHADLCTDPNNWRPLGGNDANMSIIQNQQGHPAAALVEKLTNAIDAVLMRRVLEAGIDPKSKSAPKSIEAAVTKFFKGIWSSKQRYDGQAHDIQLLAHGPRAASSLVIYDAGEGQHPAAFPDTFLSLVRGNKKDIPFVQGMYNMGGTGSIVFCGRHKYQLICSRRYDESGAAGFSLVRRHPLSKSEENSKKTTWYEYLAPGGKILEFQVGKGIDLGLRGRHFTTGSVIKLYSYALPSGLKGNIAQELFQSLNEFLIAPALPIWVADSPVRYPNTAVLERTLTGLQRTIDQKSNRLVEKHLPFVRRGEFGDISVDCYVFTAMSAEKDVQKVRESIRRQFFQNGASVLFSLNGQVQGTWTKQFVTQSLNMPLLRDYLLIVVNCTGLRAEYRNDLFMASRDRLTNSEQAQELREELKALLANSELRSIHDLRKQSLGVQSASATKAIKSCVSALSLNANLHAMLAGQLDLDNLSAKKEEGNARGGGRPSGKRGLKAGPEPETAFKGRRFPTYFRLARPSGSQESTPAARIPLGGAHTIRFNTDVENAYFRRSRKPGQLGFTLMTFRPAAHPDMRTSKAKRSSAKSALDDLVHIEASEPENGEIRVRVGAKEAVAVGDAVQIAATLSGDLVDYNEFFWVKIVEAQDKPKDKSENGAGGLAGFPAPVLIGRELKEGSDVKVTWDEAAGRGISRPVDETLLVYPLMNDARVECVYINMDSRVIEELRAEHESATAEYLGLLNNQYIATMYLHTVLLCGGMGVQGYSMAKPDPLEMGSTALVDVSEFVAELFSEGYGEFVMRFASTSLADLLDD